MQTIGDRLEEARKKKGISIREAAEATKIRGDYLQKFESNHFDIGLTEIYTRGFLRNYATFLKIPADRILNDYAALGRGEHRPRQPSREVYGRMDISVASANEGTERPAAPEEAAAPVPERAQPHYPRTGSSLPTGPDPALVFKYVKWGGIALIVLVAAFVLKSLLSSDAGPGRVAAPDGAETFTLVAKDVVFVRVNQLVGKTEGAELFRGTLARGQSQMLPWTGPVRISASAGENFEVEVRGRRWPSGFTGNAAVDLEGPSR
jgi:cytoskeleton protein RodZ